MGTTNTTTTAPTQGKAEDAKTGSSVSPHSSEIGVGAGVPTDAVVGADADILTQTSAKSVAPEERIPVDEPEVWLIQDSVFK